MKREFGSKLIEEFFPTVDVQTLIDATGAAIPGHGTPTVIVFGRARRPVLGTVRAVMGIRGEEGAPDVPAEGPVWRAIVDQVDQPGSESDFFSVEDVERSSLATHPWNLQGGGAPGLQTRLEQGAMQRLKDIGARAAIGAVTLQDDVFGGWPHGALRRVSVTQSLPFVEGTQLRDWVCLTEFEAVAPYTANDAEPHAESSTLKLLWRWRNSLASNIFFGENKAERRQHWWEYGFIDGRRTMGRSITFAFMHTHNHFVLDRGGKVFKQSAPVIKLSEGASEDEHLALLGVLNSAAACFWLQQVCHNKGAGGGARVDAGYSAMGEEPWMSTYEFTGTKLAEFPLPARRDSALAKRIDEVCGERARLLENARAAALGQIVARPRCDDGSGAP